MAFNDMTRGREIAELARSRWQGRVTATLDQAAGSCRLETRAEDLRAVCRWLGEECRYAFATLVVEEAPGPAWSLTYVYYDAASPWIEVVVRPDGEHPAVPSLSDLPQGPAFDWHEREAEDLFGLEFQGHPRLGEFVLHEDWPEGVNPMRRSFDAARRVAPRESDPAWQPPMIVSAPGSFAMPVGPVFSDFAESAHFMLETVGEDVIRTIPRFFYKYRGVEKIAEGQAADRVLLLAERFSGIAAFAHGLGFCEALEAICGIDVPPRAAALRTVLAELERLRHHAATITGICNSTALAVAAAQAGLIEEELLRLSREVARHRYLFGAVVPGGLAFDLDEAQCRRLTAAAGAVAERLAAFHRQLRYSSSFLDRLEEVGIVSTEAARSYGLVGPIARASDVARDLRKLRPYAAYGTTEFAVATETEGDGYARLRVFFREAVESCAIIRQVLAALPPGPIRGAPVAWRAGVALAAIEAPSGAAFHWVRLGEGGTVARYRVTPPAFANWHGFHLAAEKFAFQDFPIILASFGLSNAECDR
jgi:Ni,Fe-hydrogenase III large subunit/Ni,Fe-hydrogenase III component G